MENRLAMGIDNLPMIKAAFESIEGMEQFCNKILESKLAPDHFYPKKVGSNNDRDYEKGNTAAVMMVLIQGQQLGLPVMTSLQHVIPVNGLMSVKGDAAKAMVFSSGKLKKDSWKEVIGGSIEGGDMKVTMTATRADTGESLERSFSVEQAKRAGLWVTEEMTRKQDGYKYLKSAWWKYPQRMITYRALGFLCRDLFPDVLHGVYTTEEAVDIPQDETLVIESNSGVQAHIPGGGKFQEQRSKQLTGKASLQIDKRGGNVEPSAPPVEHDAMPDDSQAKSFNEAQREADEDLKARIQYPATKEESYPATQEDPEARKSIGTMLNGSPGFIKVFTEEEMKDGLNTEELNAMISCDGLMVKARDIDPGKNTNKKLRTILLAHYAGEVVQLIAKFNPEDGSPPLFDQEGNIIDGETEVPGPAPTEPEDDEIPMEAVSEDEPEPEDQGAYEASVEAEAAQDPGPTAEEKVDSNKFNIEVPELVEGSRSFEQMKTLFDEMSNQAGLDNKAYESMVNTKFPQFQKYRTKEDFVRQAPQVEINTLLNSI